MVIPLSAKGFAEFLLGGPSKKLQIVRNILRPKSKEARVIAHYYAPAVRVIRIYHSKDNDRSYLKEQLHELQVKHAGAPSPQARAKLRNNIRAINSYMELYGTRKRRIVPRPRIYYKFGQVRLSASPDLAVEENGRIKFVKLGVTKDGDKPELVRVMLRVMYQAARTRFEVQPKDVIYFDIANSGRVHAREEDDDLANAINRGCEALTSMC